MLSVFLFAWAHGVCKTLFGVILQYVFEKAVYCAEPVVQRRSVKKVFLEISHNWQEKSCARAS